MTPTPKFLRHEPCESCGSRDNVGIYSDGHKYCFGCHKFDAPSGVEGVKAFAASKQLVESMEGKIALPEDFTFELPNLPFQWLMRYSIGQMERMEHGIGWSPNLDRLIFPLYEDGELKFWTGRYFGKDARQPKYWTQGSRNEIMALYGHSHPLAERVVLVEDIVSAIKVGRVCMTMPLLGSKMPLENARKLSERFKRLVIWLDPDMKRSAFQQALKLEPWFNSVEVILSDRDPKDHTTAEIAQKLGVA